MVIFLAAILDVRATSPESASSTAPARSGGCAGCPAHDQPGDPLLDRDRRDRGDAVLHAGVAAAVAAGQASQAGSVSTLDWAYPEGSTMFYPILLYYNGFRFFQMGYASRWRC